MVDIDSQLITACHIPNLHEKIHSELANNIPVKFWLKPYILDPPNSLRDGFLSPEPMNLTQEYIINCVFHHQL